MTCQCQSHKWLKYFTSAPFASALAVTFWGILGLFSSFNPAALNIFRSIYGANGFALFSSLFDLALFALIIGLLCIGCNLLRVYKNKDYFYKIPECFLLFFWSLLVISALDDGVITPGLGVFASLTFTTFLDVVRGCYD